MYSCLKIKLNRLLNKRFFIFFFLFSIIFTNNFNYIPIYTDQIGHSVYYYNINDRSITDDLFYNNIFIDGIKKYSRSSYFIKNPDQSDWKNYFIYRQGDYIYRELNIGSNYVLTDSLNIKVHGQSKSFPGEFALLGPSENNFKDNVLQNYIINLNSNKLDLGFMYHIENIGLPLNNYEYLNKKYETIHFGLKHKSSFKKLKYNFSYFVDTGSLDIYKEINYLSELIILNFFIENNFLDFNVKSFNKNFISNIDTSTNILKNNLNYLKFDFIPNYFDKNLILGFDIKDKELYFTFSLIYKYENLRLKLYKDNFYKDFINDANLDSYFIDSFKSENIIFETSLNFQKIINNLKVIRNIEKNNTNLSFINSTKIDFSYCILNVKYYHNQADYNYIKNYINYNFHFSPNLFWSDRYKFSFDVNYNDYKVNDRNPVNLDNIFHSFSNIENKSDNFYNLKFGLIVEKFKFTYNINFISNEGFNLSNTFLPINKIAFFQVDWIFND